MLKAIVILETSVLISKDDAVKHDEFALGMSYDSVKKFMNDNKLNDYVVFGITDITIGELVKYRCERYKGAIDKLKTQLHNTNNAPGFSKFEIEFDDAFKYVKYINDKCKQYIKSEKINVIKLNDNDSNTILKNTINRAINKRVPFKSNNEHTDYGFKDVMIWEGIINYKEIKKYDKIIFFTGDLGYDNVECKKEFFDKHRKSIEIYKNAGDVTSELQRFYEEFIVHLRYYEFVESKYFRDYLKTELKQKKIIILDGKKYKIKDFDITVIAESIIDADWLDFGDEEVEAINVQSSIEILYDKNGTEEIEWVIADTLIDDNLNIMETDFHIELE